MQLENISDIISTNDATIIGILIAVIVLMAFLLRTLWKTYQAQIIYISKQDKANLEMLMSVTNTVKDVSEASKDNGEKIDSLKEKATVILGIIKERLKGPS